MIRVARVVAPQGLKGEVRLALETDFPERFHSRLDVTLKGPGGERSAVLLSFRPHRTGGVAAFEGVGSRDEATRLVGSEVLVADEARWPVPPGRHYIDDVVGLLAVDGSGEALGRVTGVLRNPAHDLYEIDGGRLLLPAHREWIAFDFPRGLLHVKRKVDQDVDAD